MKFREIDKLPLGATLPPDLIDRVRDLAHENRETISATTTRLICVALKIDPAKYGLPSKGARARKQNVVI